MSFRTKLINSLLPLAAYLLFAFQWVYNYVSAWHANIPEETQYLKGANASAYMLYAWLWVFTFLPFLLLSIIYLVRDQLSRPLVYTMITILFFTSYIVFIYSSALSKWGSGGLLNYLILVLLAISVFRFYLTVNTAKNR